jgi:hypothetical protein
MMVRPGVRPIGSPGCRLMGSREHTGAGSVGALGGSILVSQHHMACVAGTLVWQVRLRSVLGGVGRLGVLD